MWPLLMQGDGCEGTNHVSHNPMTEASLRLASFMRSQILLETDLTFNNPIFKKNYLNYYVLVI